MFAHTRRIVSRIVPVLLVAFSIVINGFAAPPYLQITSRPPKDLPSRNVSQEDLAKFAWQEFLALNWKASIDMNNPPSPSNQRGLPDLEWSYSQQAPQFPNPLVWQTYAQTTEFRPNSALTTAWQNLKTPTYSYATAPVLGIGPNISQINQNNLWNNLDEDSEIGSCDIYAQYGKQRNLNDLVLFQVRVNKDEYEYLRLNFGADQYDPNGKLAITQAKVIANITKAPYYSYYGSKPVSTCDCPPDQAICLPCGVASGNSNSPEGSIEVKSAWRRLLPSEDKSRFFTTTTIYYDLNGAGEIAYYNDTFALIGMHIIHKTANFPDFVFATFEHVDVEQSDAEYILTPGPSGAETPPAVPILRQTGQTNRVQNHPVPPQLDQVTQQVQQQLHALNPTTVWQYYRLTGVQGPSVDCPVSFNGGSVSTSNCVKFQNPIICTNLDPNYFMANFVVESDPFLNNFSGPGFGKGGDPIFPGGCQNTVYKNETYTNGGCKGCHGVAQTAFGTDFSFLLDFGNNKPSLTPATLHYIAPGAAIVKPVPLKHYLDAMKR